MATAGIQRPTDSSVKDTGNDPPAYGSKEFNLSSEPEPNLQRSSYTSSLWAEAVGKIRKELPSEIREQLPDDLSRSGASQILQTVIQEAEDRQKDSTAKEHQIEVPGKSGKKVKLRDVYGGILSFAMKFRDVGDIAIQASPPQAALPWAIVRLCLTAAFNKHEFYGVIIQGLEMVSSIVSHYIVIERVFVGVESVNARAVRNSLLTLYAAVLQFLRAALNFFPPPEKADEEKGYVRRKFASGVDKVRRTFKNLDVTYQDTVKDILNQVSQGKDNVDSDADHAYAEMNFDAFDKIGKQLDAMGYAEAERNRRLDVLREEFDRRLESIDYKVSEMYDSMKESQQENNIRQVLDWLSPATQDQRRKTAHQSLKNRRLQSSGLWLLQAKEYLQWQDSEKSSIAWVRGTSGTGKTMLMSKIVDHLESKFLEEGRSDRLAFFYVSPEQQVSAGSDPDEVIRSIVRQLSHSPTSPELEPAIAQRYRQSILTTDQPPRPMRSECADMIISLTHEFPVWIIVDALDALKGGEPSDQMRSSRNDFIESLQNIVDQSDSPVKVLLSTLPDSLAETRLRNVFASARVDESSRRYDTHVIEVNADRNSGDLDQFVKDTLTKRIHRGDLLEGTVEKPLQEEIAARLLKRSKGMFSYASLAIDRLCDESISEFTVLKEIEEFRGMTDLYERSVNEIRTQSRTRVQITAKTALKWLLCIQETLSVHEFLEAVDVEVCLGFLLCLCLCHGLTVATSLPFKTRGVPSLHFMSSRSAVMTTVNLELTSIALQGGIEKPTKNNLLSACRSLVKTDHRPATDLYFFALQHDAVRDYLKDQPEYSESDCHLTAADRCLRMMKLASFTSAGHSPEQRYFHWYANRFWPLHYQKIDFTLTGEDKALVEERRKGFDRVRKSLKEFVMQRHKTSPAFNKWLKKLPDYVGDLGKNHPLSQQLSSLRASVVTPLHAISVFGFADLIDAHSKEFDFGQRNAYGQTPLILAIDNNHVDTVKALMASGRADVNQFNLQAAQQLLEQNFEPVICYASALQAAVVQGSRAIFDLLIDHGAKLDLVAGYYGSMLQAACLKGHAELVGYLLDEARLDPNSQGGYHGNSLQAACAMGHLEIVEILLGAESEVCELAPGGHYGSAIMAATCAGSPEIIESLLAYTDDAEAMVNQRSPKYGTPLQQAADLNRKDILDLLIGHGANINAWGASDGDTSQKNSSALANAASKGNQKIVSMLVEMKAEADFSYSDGQFHLLHQAALHNMVDLARYCLEKKCDINMKTDQGVKYHQDQRKMTPLAIASVEGHIEIVELLLGEGARIQYPGDDVSTLILAASRDQADVIEALIQEHKARHSENPKSTVEFISRRVPSSKNTALHEAARLGAVCAVAKLLEHRAPFLRADVGVGVFQRATWDGRPQVVKTLVEHLERSSKTESIQAINALDDNGKSALIDAAERNRFNIFPYLLEHGADFRVRDKWGNTLLHYISTRNHHDLARMLLAAWDKEDPGDKMAWLTMTNDEKTTALQEAVRRHHYPMIRILLDAGAKITPSYRRYCLIFKERPTVAEIQNLIREGFGDYREEALKYFNHRAGQDGASILHDIATFRRLDIAQCLLDYGADPTTLDAESMLDLKRVDTATPLHLAVCANFQPMVRLLLESAARQCNKSKLACFVNRRNRLGKTALMDAAERNHFEIMDMLLSKPYLADWSVVDNQEHNALHWCAWRHHRPSVEVLLLHASGVDQSPIGRNRFAAFLKQRSKAGLTPLHDVTHQGFEDLARMLLYDYHADYEIYDNTGDSILHRAVQSNHDFLLKPYLEYMAKDKDQEKFKRVLHHRNTSKDRTVLDALEFRGRKDWADYVRKFGA